MRTLILLSTLFFAACGPAKAKCDTTTCDGCCDQMTDTCVAGSEDAACGTGGKLCVACPSTQQCSSQTCKERVSNCNANTCDGCCSNDTCQSGTSTEACGASGSTCTACSGAQTCNRVDPLSSLGGRCQ